MIDAEKTAMFTKTAADTALRLQPKSAIMGLTSTPIMRRAPAFRNMITNEAATTYQPKEMVDLVLLIVPGTDRSWRGCALTTGAYRLPGPGRCARGLRSRQLATGAAAHPAEALGERLPYFGFTLVTSPVIMSTE